MRTKPWNFKYDICTIDDCTKTHRAKGMCQMHYRRMKLYNDVNANPRYCLHQAMTRTKETEERILGK